MFFLKESTLMKRILVTLSAFFIPFLMNSTLSACSFTIVYTVTQPTCGSNGAFQITSNPPITGKFEIKQGTTQVGLKNGGGSFNTPSAYGAGLYKIIVTDLNTGCSDSVDNVLLTSTIGTIMMTPTIKKASCKNRADGEIMISGDMGNFTYTWAHSALETDSVANNLVAGNYKVTITVNGCPIEKEYTVGSIDSISFTDTFTPANCNRTDGQIFINNLTGGTPPYTFAWSNGNSTIPLTGLAAGDYILTITDSKSCPPTIKSYKILANPGPKGSISRDTVCPGEANGILKVSLITGNPVGMNYMWSHDLTLNNKEASGLQPGTYSVTLVDAGGCTDSLTSFIREELLRVVTLEASNVLHKIGTQNNFLTALPLNNFYGFEFGPDSALVNIGENRALLNPKTNTLYIVKAFYADGCIAKDSLLVKISDSSFTYIVPNVFTPNGNGRNDEFTLYDINKDRVNFDPLMPFEMHIYDRWGNEVYQSFNIKEGWDGTEESNVTAAKTRNNMNAVYGYIIKYGYTTKTILSGNITLIR